jgi:PAS domain S-box-containing protein
MRRDAGHLTRRQALLAENTALRAKLEEAEETLRAIREGEVDAIVVSGSQGDQVYSLTGAESVYRLIVETMKEAALTVTPDGRILFCNGQFSAFVQTPPARILGRPLAEYVAPDSGALLTSLLARSRTEGAKDRVVFQGPEGPPVPAYISATALCQADSLSICIVATDLTELEASTELLRLLQREQAALRASEERYRDLVELSPDAILVVHREGRIVYTNPAGVRLFGAEGPDDVVGRNVLDLMHPEERRAVTDRFRPVLEQGAIAPLADRTILRLDGRPVDVETTACRITYDGQPAIQGIYRDITERKHAERLAKAHNSISQVIHSTLDVNEIMSRSVSEAAKAIECETAAISLREGERWIVCYAHGFPRHVIGAQTSDAEEPHALLAITTKMPVAITDAFEDERVNREHMKRCGVRSVLVVPLIVRDEGVGVIFFNYMQSAFTFHHRHVDFAVRLALSLSLALENSRLFGDLQTELSERKRAEEALRQAHDSLDQQVQARTVDLSQAIQTLEQQARQLRTLTAELTLAEQRERRRLADVLHDGIQQLLVAARLRAHLLGRSPDAGVQAGAHELVALLEEALAQTRSLTGELSPPVLQTGNLLPAVEWLARWMEETHQVTVHVRPAAALPPLAAEVAVVLYQAVRELLLNAVKHAQVSAAEVTLTPTDEAFTCTVADAGVGFDPTRLRVVGGTEGGFGLLAIHERLEAVGGRLEIASASGQGSRVTVIVPRRPTPEMAPTVRPAGAPAAGAGAPPSARRLRILVVDDHALVRRGVATLLAGEPDLEVVGEADNGQRAIELTRQLIPEVILMDVSMPILNGIDATRAIHAEFPALRVIGFSMVEDPEQPEAMRQAGAVTHLSKNDSAEALLAAIREGGAPVA